ncbi:MAG TPA: RuBisCO large subunit C-terminal-like domain-containing protein [Alphaproteobacteria bacterium]|nr:RuBisCO large subunit C-terminal-like domain-containing protein [Alphaproteobacteria bacterium]
MSHLPTTLQSPNLVRTNDIVATYIVRSRDLDKAAAAIAIGQSLGNPSVRLKAETKEMWDRFGAIVRNVKPHGDGLGVITIGYAVGNQTPRSFTHLLAVLMGGQMDIDLIEDCRLVDLEFPADIVKQYRGPSKGIEGIRAYTGARNRPLVGGIVKPKTGITPDQVADVCKRMADGGIDFIKDDEILGDILTCSFATRIEKVSRALEGYNVIYAPCVTSPIDEFPNVAAQIKRVMQPPAFHYNVWGGFDSYQYLASLVGGFAYYQKSGDKVVTEGKFSIDFSVWCKFIRLAGADVTHAGMLGGYLNEPLEVMKARLMSLSGPWHGLRSTLPSLSCGATPGMVPKIIEQLGVDVMIASGGCLHAHPDGSYGGAKAFRDAAEGKSSKELDIAIEKFGR